MSERITSPGRPGVHDYRLSQHGEDRNAIDEGASLVSIHVELNAVTREIQFFFSDGWVYIEPIPDNLDREGIGHILMYMGYRMKEHKSQQPQEIVDLKGPGKFNVSMAEIVKKREARRGLRKPKAAPPMPDWNGYPQQTKAIVISPATKTREELDKELTMHKSKIDMFNILHWFLRCSVESDATIALMGVRDLLLDLEVSPEQVKQAILSRLSNRYKHDKESF